MIMVLGYISNQRNEASLKANKIWRKSNCEMQKNLTDRCCVLGRLPAAALRQGAVQEQAGTLAR